MKMIPDKGKIKCTSHAGCCRSEALSVTFITTRPNTQTLALLHQPGLNKSRYTNGFLEISCCRVVINLIWYYFVEKGTRWPSDRGTALQTGRSRVRFPMVSLEVFIDILLPVAL
jgi:hypothetical protein